MLHRNNNTTPDEFLSDINLSSWRSQTDSHWNQLPREHLAATSQQVEPDFTSKAVLVGVITALVLLSATALMQVPRISQALQDTGKISVKQLIQMNY